jgi:hypothetical protein
MPPHRTEGEPHDLTPRDKIRFWAKVDKTGKCWLWTGATYGPGYGHFKLAGKARGAHRVAWLLAHGEWPKLHVLHTCDTPRCVRPDHLFIGTDADNAADRDAKGRWWQPSREGEGNGQAKLTAEQIAEIRAIGDSRTRVSVGAEYDVAPQTIGKIVKGQRW